MAPLKTVVGVTRWKPPVKKQKVPKGVTTRAGVNKFAASKGAILQKLAMKKRAKKTAAIKDVPKMKLKPGLKPGSICIILEGRHKGKRVVFLKQLLSGFCVVTGPFGLNKCPMRRIHQNLLIATSVQLDLKRHFKNFSMEPIDDKFFRRLGVTKKKNIDGVRIMKVRYYRVSLKRRVVQRKVDNEVLKAIAKHKNKNDIWRYLCTKFCLKNKDYPHCLKF